MSKHLKLGAVFIIGMLLFTGCGSEVSATPPESVTQDSIYIDKNGTMVVYIVRDFDKDYYNLSELNSMAQEEVEEYDKENGADTVVLKEVNSLPEDSNRVCAVYEYVSYEDYNAFNDDDFFYGIVSDTNIDLSQAKSIKNGSAADKTALSDKHVIVTDEHLVLYCPYGVSYLSDGVVLNEDNSVDTTKCEGQAIIIMNK